MVQAVSLSLIAVGLLFRSDALVGLAIIILLPIVFIWNVASFFIAKFEVRDRGPYDSPPPIIGEFAIFSRLLLGLQIPVSFRVVVGRHG